MTDRNRYLDPDAAADLAEQGLPGYVAAESVDSGGRRELWLVNVDGLDQPGTDHGATTPPAHETDGPLPAHLRRLFAHRCGRRRTNGQPCRSIVPTAGAACPAHRAPIAPRPPSTSTHLREDHP